MKLVGYIDRKRHFIRDEILPHELKAIAGYVKELTDFHKKRLVLFVEDNNIIRMIQN